jgi:hypothetical protein
MAFVAAIPEVAEAVGIGGGAEAAGAAEGGEGLGMGKMPGKGLFNDRRMRSGNKGGGTDPSGPLAAAKASQGA